TLTLNPGSIMESLPGTTRLAPVAAASAPSSRVPASRVARLIIHSAVYRISLMMAMSMAVFSPYGVHLVWAKTWSSSLVERAQAHLSRPVSWHWSTRNLGARVTSIRSSTRVSLATVTQSSSTTLLLGPT